MVDYSKWDNLVVSSDEEEEEEAGRMEPSVYRVGPSGSVTIPGRNVTIHGSTGQGTADRPGQAVSTQRKAQDNKGNIADLRKKTGPTDAGKGGGTGEKAGQLLQQQQQKAQAKQQSTALKALKERKNLASHVTLDELTRNGGETDAYVWSQTHNTVRVSFIVDRETRAKDVRLRVDAAENTLEARVEGTQWSYAGTMFGPIAPVDEPEDLDWTLVTVYLQRASRAGVPAAAEQQQGGETEDHQGNKQGAGRGGGEKDETEEHGTAKAAMPTSAAATTTRELRLLQVDLVKKDLAGLVMWWKSAFKGDAEIDTSALKDRSTSQGKASSTFAENYRKAHAMFVERMRSGDKRTPIELDIDMDESPDDNDDADDNDYADDNDDAVEQGDQEQHHPKKK